MQRVKKLKDSAIAAAVFTAISCFSTYSQAQDKLLLTEHSREITMNFRIDGGAVRAMITNQGQLALTSGTLVCAPYDLNQPRPKRYEDCESIVDPIESYAAMKTKTCVHSIQIVEQRFPFEGIVLPKKSKELYFELYSSTFPVTSCRLEGLRGREKRLWDF